LYRSYLARARLTLGHGEESGKLLREAVDRSDEIADDQRAVVLFHFSNWLHGRGKLEEVLRIARIELLPLLENLGAERERAVTLGQIADVLAARGELDEALRIRREEQLPVYERLGDVQSMVVARANIALVLLRRQRAEDTPEALDHLHWAYQAAR